MATTKEYIQSSASIIEGLITQQETQHLSKRESDIVDAISILSGVAVGFSFKALEMYLKKKDHEYEKSILEKRIEGRRAEIKKLREQKRELTQLNRELDRKESHKLAKLERTKKELVYHKTEYERRKELIRDRERVARDLEQGSLQYARDEFQKSREEFLSQRGEARKRLNWRM